MEDIDPKVMRALMKANSKLPSEDKTTFTKISLALMDSWGLKRPQEIMLVNRMVATWMKMKKCEDLMAKYDLYFEKRDDKGNLIGITMNQLAFYLKSLEADFRNYYKTIQTNIPSQSQQGITDFKQFLDAKKVDDGSGSDQT